MGEHVHRRVLEHRLQRSSNRLVPRSQRLVGAPRGSEERFELRREYRTDRRLAVLPRHRHAVRRVAEVRQIQLEPAIVEQADEVSKRADFARLAVRREPHHLELVAVLGKAEELRDGEVQNAERMREEHAPVDVERAAAHAAP